MRNPDAAVEEQVEARPEPADTETCESEGHCHGEHNAVAEEQSEMLDHSMAEHLIGLDEAHVDDQALASLSYSANSKY